MEDLHGQLVALERRVAALEAHPALKSPEIQKTAPVRPVEVAEDAADKQDTTENENKRPPQLL